MRDLYAFISGAGFLASAGGTAALCPTPGGVAFALLLAAIGAGFLYSRDADFQREIADLELQILRREL